MNPATEIRLLVARELRRSTRSVKGIVLGIITLSGAIVASVALVWMQGAALQAAGSQEALAEMRREMAEKQTGDAGLAAQVAHMPQSLQAFLSITIWLGPLLIALLGFDTMAGELQNKAVRFWTVRSRRWSYFAGKTLGLWFLVGLITLALNAIVGGVALAKGFVTPGELVTWGSRCWLVAFVIAGAWAAIATLISSFFKQPIVALLTTFGTFFALWLTSVAGSATRVREMMETGTMPAMRWYEYVYPNAYETMLLAPEAGKVLTAVAVLVGFVVAVVAGGSLVFQQRDV